MDGFKDGFGRKLGLELVSARIRDRFRGGLGVGLRAGGVLGLIRGGLGLVGIGFRWLRVGGVGLCFRAPWVGSGI